MNLESQILLLTAASIAFLHTILGPDHYLVFTAMGKARGWSLVRTLRVTLLCGAGHVLSSVVIGAAGLLLGAQLGRIVDIESTRGDLAGWALLAFGLVYMAWGIRRAGRAVSHSHVHAHENIVHEHHHDHRSEHMHVHDQKESSTITPWAIFIVSVLGPCESLIPLFMYPAAQRSPALVLAVAAVFGVVTLLTMLAAVTITTIGIEKLKLPSTGRYVHAAAGASIAACGAAISFLGL